jgi:hypothetical protein
MRYDLACLCAFAGYVTCGAAYAADNCSGTNANVAQLVDTTELAKGHTLMTVKNSSTVVSDDPSKPWHLAAGDCVGTFIVSPDGSMQGNGHCQRKDRDGDVYDEEWSMPAPGGKGSWKLLGGTGKWAGTQNSGWWQGVMSQGKMSAVRWGGTCK